MDTDQTPIPPAVAPLVSQVTDVLSRHLAEVFAEQQLRAERERAEAVAAAVAGEAESRARELVAQRAALDAQFAALRDDYDSRFDAEVARARDERDALEERWRVEVPTALEAARREAAAQIAEARERGEAAAPAAVAAATAAHEVERQRTSAHTRIAEREQALAAGARLLASFERLDAARTLRETLDALGAAAAAEVARVVVLVVRGSILRGWSLAGFTNAPAPAASVSFSRDEAGPLSGALTQGVAVQVHPTALAEAVPALGWVATADGDDATAGIAVPLIVDGQPVALMYCDDGLHQDRSVPAAWPETLQVLVRHAGRCLEALTARRAAGFGPIAPVVVPLAMPVAVTSTVEEPSGAGPSPSEIEAARRFARLVVSELKLYNEAAVVAGREARDLRVRLRDELARARRLYEARVPATLPARDDYFDQEVVRTLADGDPALLGDPATSAA